MAKTSDLVFQTESWGFDADKITVGDTSVEDYRIKIAPGTSGVIPLTVDNSGEDAETVQIGVTISKNELEGNTPLMEEELQKRIFFYADTGKSVTYENDQGEEVTETVSKVYLGSSAPDNYTYTILPGQILTMNDVYYNDIPLKWECVLDMTGYYFHGTVAKAEDDTADVVEIREYIRPIEYDYFEDQPVYGENQQLLSIKGKTTAEFLAEISSKDGYEGTIDSEEAVVIEVETDNGDTTEAKTCLYYPVEVDSDGYGTWAYLCTKEEVEEGIAYDNGIAGEEEGVLAAAVIVLTANNTAGTVTTASTVEEFTDALSDPETDIVGLGANVTLTESLTIAADDKIIDLNGYTLTSDNSLGDTYNLITVDNDTSLTVLNGTITGSSNSTAYGAMQTKAFDLTDGNLVLSGVNVTGFDSAVYIEDMNADSSADENDTAGDSTVQIINSALSAKQIALVLQGNGAVTDAVTKVIVQNSTLNSEYGMAISGQGNDDRWGTELVLADSTISGYYTGLYQPQRNSLTTISGCTITGYTGIAVKGGTVNIYDSSITGTGDYAQAAAAGSGFTDTGDGVYVEAVYDWSTAVTIHGEKTVITSKKAYAVELFGQEGKGPGTVVIYDGQYTGEKSETNWNSIGTFTRYDVTETDASEE